MSYSCKILLDSISETGKRLTTMEITFPRIVLSEFNTHRAFSRNSASSRAIPFSKQIEKVKNHPFIPERFPLNCSGMQPQEYVTKDDSAYKYYVDYWLGATNNAVNRAQEFYDLKKPHKQIVNRLLEPFMWHTVIVTATEWDNFFKLRCDNNAQYEIKRIADLMYEAYHAYEHYNKSNKFLYKEENILINDYTEIKGDGWIAILPQELKIGEWHCPLVSEEDYELINDYVNKDLQGTAGEYDPDYWKLEFRKRISVARCARISYLTHNGKRDIEKDLELFEKLKTSGHYSPFEHVATPHFINYSNLTEVYWSNLNYSNRFCDTRGNKYSANFIGWRQYRKDLPNENCINFRKEG